MNLLLQRKPSDELRTHGDLYVLKSPPGDRMWECHTLEDPVREVAGKPVSEWKIKSQTAIPQGRYKIVVNWSNRFKQHLPLLLDVPGFEGIRIHAGNSEQDTEGCILVGQGRNLGMVLRSRAALEALMNKILAAIGNEEIWIEIRSAEPQT